MEYAFGTFTRYECLCYILGGFFKYVLCSPLGEDSYVDEQIFQMGWNHQPVLLLEWWFQDLLFLPYHLVRKWPNSDHSFFRLKFSIAKYFFGDFKVRVQSGPLQVPVINGVINTTSGVK